MSPDDQLREMFGDEFMDGVDAYDAGPLAFFEWSEKRMNTQAGQAQEIAQAYQRGRAEGRVLADSEAIAERRYGYEQGHHDARRRGRWLILIATAVAAVAGHWLW